MNSKSALPVFPAPTTRRPPSSPPIPPGSSVSLDDIYYTLFRHKRKILLCTFAGLLGAAVAMVYMPPTYESQAKLFVRYVVSEGPAQASATDDLVMKSPDMRGETIINSEEQILTSFDTARQVAQIVGPERILARSGGGNDLTAAAIVINRGLVAQAPKFSSVIDVGFRHPDPTLVQPVLNEVITLYLKRHVEIHRAAGLVGDFLAQETDQLRARLTQTEADLRKVKSKGAVISVDDAKKEFASQLTLIRQQIFAAEAELAEREAIVQHTSAGRAKDPANASTPATASSVAGAPTRAETEIPATVRDEYRALAERLESLRTREQQALLTFTPENAQVREIRNQIATAKAARQQMETTYPDLVFVPPTTRPTATDDSSRRSVVDPAAENARIVALKAKIKTLTSQLDSVRSGAAALEGIEGTIEDLTRTKELEEANYRRYAASLEQSRINEALGSGKVSNISVIQTPSPPMRDADKTGKLVTTIAIGGVGVGLAWAFLIELLFDRTIRRRGDVEKKLGLPLFLSVPAVVPHKSFWKRRRNQRLLAPVNGAGRQLATAPDANHGAEVTWKQPADELQPFHETLRDRLIGYFERVGLSHRPKLVTVTGVTQDAGTTTTAAGLARCLSETGEGNVLLVDLTPEQRSAQQFYHGKPVCELDNVLAVRNSEPVQGKLYVVSDNRGSDLLSRELPQRFKSLVPKLKTSDFDYIIFDMPPINQISITPRLAGFMDMVLLVIESEKTSLDVVQRATTLLEQSVQHVGVVLNKTRTYVPRLILQEDIGE